VLLIAAVMLSFAVSTVITNPRVLLADLLAISLLYFFCADFVYVARLGAYSRLRPLSEAESRMRLGACGSSSRSGQIWEVRT
jgi:hypothetical protein